MRNPLASIISGIQVNLSKERSIEEYKQCLHSVLEDAIDLEHTSTHLLELARISSKSDTILFGKTRLDEIIWQSKALVRKSNPGYSFKFEIDELPEESDKLMINANEALLKTALVNLLENACKFSPDHKANIKLSVLKNNMLSVEIKDTAPLIPESEKEQIFKPFYRMSGTSKFKGTGIGLSLVASIIKIHDARLDVKDNAEKGNIFTILFKMSK